MPLTTIQDPDTGQRFTAWICGRGAGGPKPCYACGHVGDWQCDAFVVPPGTRPRRRCNRHICQEHRTPLGPNKDACPEHAPACLAALELRAAALEQRKATAKP